MSVLPGSLDYLYHNGIIDYIPYEAYQMSPMTPSAVAQFSGMASGLRPNVMLPDYHSSQMQGAHPSNNYNQNIYPQNIYPSNIYPQGDYFVNNTSSISRAVDKFTNAPTWAKGLLTAGIMFTTLFCMFRSGKKPSKQVSQSAPVQEVKNNIWNKFKGWFGKK